MLRSRPINQQLKPQSWRRICQMVLQSKLHMELTSCMDLPREDKRNCNHFVTILQM